MKAARLKMPKLGRMKKPRMAKGMKLGGKARRPRMTVAKALSS